MSPSIESVDMRKERRLLQARVGVRQQSTCSLVASRQSRVSFSFRLSAAMRRNRLTKLIEASFGLSLLGSFPTGRGPSLTCFIGSTTRALDNNDNVLDMDDLR